MKSNIPKLRFKEFIDEWQGHILHDLLEESKKRNFDNKFNKNDVLSVSGEFGIVNQIELKGRSFAGAFVNNYHTVEIGDIVYTKSPLKLNPYGIIKHNSSKPGIVSTLYAVYKCKGESDPKFLDYYFRLHDRVNKYLRPLVHKGAKNDMKISNSHVLDGSISTPTILEQQKISMFLAMVDEKINKLEEKKKGFEKYKKGVMQTIFSQKIRFKKPDGSNYIDWREKRIGEVFDQREERYMDGSELLSVTISSGVIRRSDIEGNNNASENMSNYKKVCKNDIVYNSMRMWQGASGASLHNGVVSPAYTVLKGSSENNSNFFSYYFKLPKIIHIFERHSQGLTSDTWNLKYNQIAKIRILVPSKMEQEKIAEFLTSLDNKVDLINKQLEKAKLFKKSLLQQMFV